MRAYDDSRFINPETLRLYANTNEAFLQAPVRGILPEYPGHGGDSCLGGHISPTAPICRRSSHGSTHFWRSSF